MKGLDIYKTKDGFTVARLHYTADKDKIKENGDPVDALLEGYIGGRGGAAWRKEMEIDFTAYSGQLLCYDLLIRHRHKIIVDKYVKENDYKFGSIDWGRNNPASFHVYAVNEDKHIHSAYEVYVNQTSIPDFCSLIKACPYYQSLNWISGDPSMWNKNQEDLQDLRSLNDKFCDEGIRMVKGKSRDDEVAINELLDRWDKLDDREPTFTISPRCPKQIWEFERLRYKEITTAMIENFNPHETLVDKDNHSWDDFKYFISRYISTPGIDMTENLSHTSPLYKMQELRRRRENK